MAATLIPINNPRRPEDATPHAVRVFIEELMDFISKNKVKLPGFKSVFLYRQPCVRLYNDDIGKAVIMAVNMLDLVIEELYAPLKGIITSEEAVQRFLQVLKNKLFPEDGSVFKIICFLAVSVRIGISVTLQCCIPKGHGVFIQEIAKILTEDLEPKISKAGGWYRVMDLMVNISQDQALMGDAVKFNPGDPNDYC